MQFTWPMTGLTSATSHFAEAAGAEVSANAAPLIAVNPSRIVPIVFTMKLSRLLLKFGNYLKAVVLICGMSIMTQRRDKPSLIGRLQVLLRPSAKSRPSKVAQPGARPAKADIEFPSRPDAGFGKRKRRKR